LALPQKRLTAIHEAAAPFFYPRSRTAVEAVKKQLGLPTEYLLSVGTIEPRKNLSTLVRALAVCKQKIPLVLVGWSGWEEKNWMENLAPPDLLARIYRTGYVDEETLACLYTGARAFVYPSLYEGFGLPVLEAMACGVPVVCANVSSLPEVAGSAALLVAPTEVAEMAYLIDSLWMDDDLRQRKALEGKERCKQFSWADTARKTYDVFKNFHMGRAE
jgi:alpha-1,3-rhamnosyl/mannosyltransferase